MEKSNLYIGVMSGTSLDGIDIALCSVSEDKIETLQVREYEYDLDIKEDVLKAILEPISLEFIGVLNHKLALMYIKALKEFLSDFDIDSKDIRAIGLHGQTIWHSPNTPFPFSLQLGDGSLVAKKLQIDVVNDFRSADMANGGQGAPIAPAFHKALFDDKSTAVLNLGGIANITVLSDDFIGFDVGVANIFSDYWIAKHQNKPYDKDGEFASKGKVNEKLLELLLSDSYFELKPPKSTGREYFNPTWLEERLKFFSDISAVDVQRTLIEFTITPIVKAIQDYKLNKLLVCGGGAHNVFLMDRLAQELTGIKVIKSDELGVDSTFLEAIAFAWLAYKRVNHETIDLTTITGASRASILGVIHAKD